MTNKGFKITIVTLLLLVFIALLAVYFVFSNKSLSNISQQSFGISKEIIDDDYVKITISGVTDFKINIRGNAECSFEYKIDDEWAIFPGHTDWNTAFDIDVHADDGYFIISKQKQPMQIILQKAFPGRNISALSLPDQVSFFTVQIIKDDAILYEIPYNSVGIVTDVNISEGYICL